METKKEKKRNIVPGRFAYRYSIQEQQEAVRQLESGVARKALLASYQINPLTLAHWVKKYATTYTPVVHKQYTSLQRRSVVRAVESGMSLEQAGATFGVSNPSVRKWLMQAKAENAELSAFVPMKKPEQEKPQEQDMKALERQLAEAQLKIRALETMIDIAESQLKIDIRKKSGAKQSPK